MGRTNIEIDDDLVEKAMRFTGARTKREVVDIALRRLVQKASLYRKIRRLRGKLEWTATSMPGGPNVERTLHDYR